MSKLEEMKDSFLEEMKDSFVRKWKECELCGRSLTPWDKKRMKADLQVIIREARRIW